MDSWTHMLVMNIAVPFIVFALVMLAARRFKNPKQFSKKRAVTAGRNIVLMIGNGGIYSLCFMGLEELSGRFLMEHLPFVSDGAWDGVPLALTAVLGLLALDFANYWNHRLMHTKFVWAVHAVHHSDKHMTWTTSYRIHVFQALVMTIGYGLIVLPLNLPVEAMGIAAFINGAHNQYAHCQLEWTHGPLRKWIVSPNYHRWHHADKPEAYNKNIADMFVMWDRMFGTYYDPGICKEQIGLPDGPETLPEIMVYPFKYWWQTYGPRKAVKPADAVPSA